MLDSRVSFSRSSAAWYFNSSGLLTQAASGVARFDYGSPGSSTLNGLLIEGQSTNLALQSRDLTQAAWTKTSATAAKDQTGIDGAANSASSLTATANGGTCLQSITQASTQDTFSVYLKRITGTGTVKITLDGGTTYTDVTASLSTSAWFRATATETVTNPSIGIQLGTSGDKIAVDVAQLEAQAFASSPIITTSATVTRAADVATASLPTQAAKSGTVQADVMWPTGMPAAASGGGTGILLVNDGAGSTTNDVYAGTVAGGSSGALQVQVRSAGSTVLSAQASSPYSSNIVHRVNISYGGATYAYSDGTLVGSAGAATPSSLTTVNIGNAPNFTPQINGWVKKIIVWGPALSQSRAQSASLTQ